jgi:hypothetical protein
VTAIPPPWWTSADDAELDLLVDEFVRVAFVHRDRCSVCSAGGPWCEPLHDAFDGLLGWRRGREFRSKAEWLRARQEGRAA